MWTPNPQGVMEVVSLLESTVNARASTQTLNESRARLEQLAATNTEFIRYLAFVFAQNTQFSVEVRALAGLILKNELKRSLHGTWSTSTASSSELLLFIRDSFLPCLDDANKLVRSTAAHVLAMLIANTPLLTTSRIIADLVDCVKQEQSYELRDGASLAMLFIAEDCPCQVLDSDEAGRPLNVLIPFWIECFATAALQLEIRTRAMQCVQVFLYSSPPAMQTSFPALINALRAVLGHAQLSQICLETVTIILETWMDDFAGIPPPVFAHFTQFALQAIGTTGSGGGGGELERQACEFFEAALRHEEIAEQLNSPDNAAIIRELVPKLCQRLVYSEEDLFEMEDDTKIDAHVPDTLQDVLPPRIDNEKYFPPQHREEQEEGEEGGEDDTLGPHAAMAYWTTRRIAGLILDTLSKQHEPAHFLSLLLPTLQAQMRDQHAWLQVEAAILCVGAIAEGDAIRWLLLQQSPQLLDFLFTQCDAARQPNVLIRRISLWTLSRFAPVLCEDADLLPRALRVVCAAFKDGNKRNQSAALVALRALLVYDSEHTLMGRVLPQLIPTMTLFLSAFQMNNSILLLDCFAELFPVGNEVDFWQQQQQQLPEFILLILQRFQTMDAAHPAFDSLTGVLINAFSYLPAGTLPVEQVMDRAQQLMQTSGSADQVPLTLVQLVNTLVTYGHHHVPALVLDMVFAIANLNTKEMEGNSDLVEAALGVLGDVCTHCPAPVFAGRYDLPALFIRIAETLDEDAPDMVRNAIWALFELIKSEKQAVSPDILKRLIHTCGNIILLRERHMEWAHGMGDLCAVIFATFTLRDLHGFTQCFCEIGTRNEDAREIVGGWTKIIIRMSEDEPARQVAIVGWATFVRSQLSLAAGGSISIILATMATLDFREVDGNTHQVLLDLARAIKLEFQADWDKKIKPLSRACRVQLWDLYGI